MQIGWAAGGAVYGLNRIWGFDIDTSPDAMGYGVNMGFHIGTGITDRIDLTIKFFFFNLGWFYKYPRTYSFDGDSYETKLKDVFQYSFGLKARYLLVKKIDIMKYVKISSS